MKTTDQSTAQLLGYLGLIPFIGLAGVAASGLRLPGVDAASALLVYAALILSFLGGISWGVAVTGAESSQSRRRQLFGVSVLPSLVAWPAVLLPFAVGIWIVLVGFVLIYLHDRRLARQGVYPQWFARLRGVLTGVAVAALTVAAVSAA
jgi:hypothetical protein